LDDGTLVFSKGGTTAVPTPASPLRATDANLATAAS